MDKAAVYCRRTSLIAIAVALLLGAPMGSVAGADEHVVPFTTVAAGTASGIRTLTLVVIRNPAEWTRVWHQHAEGARGKDAAEPTIDFTQQMVIAVFAGEVGLDTRVTIIKIVQDKQRLQVVYRIGAPQPGPTPLDLSAATPFHIVRLARTPHPVTFVPAVEKDTYCHIPTNASDVASVFKTADQAMYHGISLQAERTGTHGRAPGQRAMRICAPIRATGCGSQPAPQGT